MGLFNKNKKDQREGLIWDDDTEIVYVGKYPHDWTQEKIEEYERTQQSLSPEERQKISPNITNARSGSISICSHCGETYMSIYDQCSSCGYPRK